MMKSGSGKGTFGRGWGCCSFWLATAAVVPVSPHAIRFCRAAAIDDATSVILGGGDDYQIVLVAPVESRDALARAGLTCIGKMVTGSDVRLLQSNNHLPNSTGWLHRR